MKRPAPRVPRHLLRDPGHLLAFGLGTGLAPRAPGTAGTLLGVLLYLALMSVGVGHLGLILVTLAVTAVGLWCSGRAARALGAPDHPGIVIDEVAGLLLSMWLVPGSAVTVLAGFALFRFFDIVKPWPIRLVDRRLHGGAGIMLDDLLAGAAACLCLHALLGLGLG